MREIRYQGFRLAHVPSDELIEKALRNCELEAVHTPGAIQPHGGLIGVEDSTLTICHASVNISRFLRVLPEVLLGRKIRDVFAQMTQYGLESGVRQCKAAKHAVDLGELAFGEHSLFVTACPSNDLTLFEFENVPKQSVAESKTSSDLELLLTQARRASSEQDFFEKSVTLLKSLTGYDRVAVLDFDAEGNCTVEAEAVSVGVDSFLGLRFPAWDIPAQARRLMMKTSQRYFYHVNAAPVPIQSLIDPSASLDLTHAQLRASSPIHMEYMRNMGVASSFTLNVVLGGALWGIIAFHHASPRYPSPRVRQMCRYYLDFFILQLSKFRTENDLRRLGKPEKVRRTGALKAENENLNEISGAELLRRVSDALNAEGAAFVTQNNTTVVGLTPATEKLNALVQMFTTDQNIRNSVNVRADYPEIADLMPSEIAGLLAVTSPGYGSILFFRAAQDQIVRWAGAPKKEVSHKAGVKHLRPRSSFNEHLQSVAGAAPPWTLDEIRIAEDLRVLMSIGERTEPLRETERLKPLLADELNSHFQSILAMIRPVSQLNPFAKRRCMLVGDGGGNPGAVRVLEQLGFATIDTAVTAQDALHLIVQLRPDIAILDISSWQEHHAKTVPDRLSKMSIPFVYVAEHDDAAAANMRHPTAPVVKKPLQEDELRRALRVLEP